MRLIRNLAITLFRQDGHASITDAIDRFGNTLDELLRMAEFASS